MVNSEPEAMSYEVKPTKVRESFPNEDRVELGSANVFADLGLVELDAVHFTETDRLMICLNSLLNKNSLGERES